MTRGTGWTPPGEGLELAPDTPGYNMTMAKAAVMLGTLPAKLAEWRRRHIGPSWRRESQQRNSAIFYSEVEIKAVRKSLDEFRRNEPKAAVRERIATAAAKPRRRRA